MLYYDRIDTSEAIDPTKSYRRKECNICHYCIFNHGSKFQDFVCNGCHNLTMSSNIAIITVKNIDFRCIIHKIHNKSEGITLSKKSVFENREYLEKHCLNFQSTQASFF